MVNILKLNKKIFIPLIIVVSLGFLIVSLQSWLTKVSAQVIPVTVLINHLDFGTVFPGEELARTFDIMYSEEEGSGIYYRIVQKIKPLPGAIVPEGYEGSIRDYCQDNAEDQTRCYRNLCPHLTKVSEDGEGDIEDLSFVGGEGDTADMWTVYFKVPAIFGFLAQDHIGGVVSESGEYGCDISVDILLQPATICGTKFFDSDQNREFYGNDYALPDWTINLLEFTDCTSGENCYNGWEIVATEVTDENGQYCFNSVQPNTYRIEEVLKPDWIATIPVNPAYFQFTVNEGQTLNYVDFGNYSDLLD